MTNQQHPITPPSELVEQWIKEPGGLSAVHVATQAARWGADTELRACCELLDINGCPSKWIDMLRAARRPKPPSLAEQALDSLDRLRSEAWCEGVNFDLDPIRRALERLQELEKGNE